MTRMKRYGGFSFVLGLVCGLGFWAGRGEAQGQQSNEVLKEAQAQRNTAAKVLRDFAQAVQNNDVEAAIKLFPTEEDLKTILPADKAQQSSVELRSAIKMNFHEYVEALKAFGKSDLVTVEPGVLRQLRRGELGAISDARIAENGYIAFARDNNYYIELRFNTGGLLRIRPDRWVLTNMETRVERFSTIKPEKAGG